MMAQLSYLSEIIKRNKSKVENFCDSFHELDLLTKITACVQKIVLILHQKKSTLLNR